MGRDKLGLYLGCVPMADWSVVTERAMIFVMLSCGSGNKRLHQFAE